MNERVTRRFVLGGVVTLAAGGAGYLLSGSRARTGRWLHPVDPVAESTEFAYVAGVVDDPEGAVMDISVALRDRSATERTIELFATADDPVEAVLPPLRGFWRFEADVSGRPTGTHRLRVGERGLDVALDPDLPSRYTGARIQLTPRSTWRSDYVAHAHGYGRGDGTGQMRVAFRTPAGSAAAALDAVGFRDPRGRLVGRRPLEDAPATVTFDLDPLEPFAEDGILVAFRDGTVVDNIELFYH